MKNKVFTTPNTSLSLSKVFWLSTFGDLSLKKQKVKLPEKLGGYFLVKTISKNSTFNEFQIGVYKNRTGKKVLVKGWFNKSKNLSYYTLVNESKTYQILTDVRKRISKSLPAHITKVHFPKLITIKEDNDSLILISEFIEGRTIEDMAPRNKYKYFNLTKQYLVAIGNSLTEEERISFTSREGADYVSIYLLALVKSIFEHPANTYALFKGVPVFLAGLSELLKQKTLHLTHRDLHGENIIVGKKDIGVIDPEFAAFTLPEYEYLSSIANSWGDKEYCQLLLKDLAKTWKLNHSHKNLIRALMVHIATHFLSSRNLSVAKIKGYLEFLEFAITSPSLVYL